MMHDLRMARVNSRLDLWSLRPQRVVTLGLLMFVLVGSPVLFAQSDDFDGEKDDGWTRYDPLASVGPDATYSFPDGGYRIEVPSSTSVEDFGQARAAAIREDTTYTDFFVSVDLIDWNDTLGQAIGPLARISDLGPGSTDGYLFFYQPVIREININRIDNELGEFTDEIDPMANFEADLDPDKDYRMTFRGIGSHLVGQVFDLADLSTPVASLSATDSTYASGHSGIVVAATAADRMSPGDAAFDNYLATVPGDFNEDIVLSAEDIDLLSAEIDSSEPRGWFDLNNDDMVDQDDRSVWVHDLKQTSFGDADLDGKVDFADFLLLSGSFSKSGGWAMGDFDGSGDVAFADFLILSENFGASKANIASVPEPSCQFLVLLGLASSLGLRQSRVRLARTSSRSK